MITVPEAVETIVKRSRYLSEAMSKGIINTSALSRYIKSELEEMLKKPISDASVIMAVNRLSGKIQPQYKFRNVFRTPPDMIFRSNLAEITIANSEDLEKKYPQLLHLPDLHTKYFFTITKGVFDTTIIVSKDLVEKVKEILRNEVIIAEYSHLASVTVRLPQETIKTPGIFYFFLKSLAWEGVNIIELVSAHLELTIIFEEHEAQKAFAILQSLFSKENRETF